MPQRVPIDEFYFYTPGKLSGAFPYVALVTGNGVARAGGEFVRKRFHQHCLILTTSGQGLIEVGGQKFIATPGTLAWLDTALQYAHGSASAREDWLYLWMGIEGYGLDGLFEFLRLGSNPLIGGLDFAETAAAFELVVGFLRERAHSVDSVISATIANLLARCVAVRQAEAESEPAGERGIQPALRAMRRDLAAAWSVEALAALCGLSPSQFHRRFRQTVGTSPIDWLRHERINGAKRLLIETPHKIAAVAAQCGYADPYHFSRDFRRVTGRTASGFRRAGGT